MTYFLLTGTALEIFTKTNQASLPFTQETIKFQEIVDRKAFEAQIKAFFSKIKSGEAIFFLGDDVSFVKTLNQVEDSLLEKEAQVFFSTVPFQKDFLAKKIVRLKKQILLIAAHRDYFETIIQIAASFGWQIKHIVSVSLFESLIAGKQINFSLLSSIAKHKEMLEAADFYQEDILQEEKAQGQEEDGTPEDTFEEKKPGKLNMKAQYIIVVVCLVCFVGALYYAYPILFPSVPQRSTPTVSEASGKSITPTPTIMPTPVYGTLGKSDIKIEVLNGSGIAGQATVIKSDLVSAGFTSIETGNAPTAATESAAIVSSQVSKAAFDDLVTQLKKSLGNITVQQSASPGAYDVIITTGTPQ